LPTALSGTHLLESALWSVILGRSQQRLQRLLSLIEQVQRNKHQSGK